MVDRDFNNAAKIRQGEKLQAERDEAARQKRLAAQQEAAKRKPHAKESQALTPIESRILVRAENHMKIRAAIEAGDYSGGLKPKPTATARARWDKAVESAGAECNGNRARAVALVARQFPKLRQQLVAEANRH